MTDLYVQYVCYVASMHAVFRCQLSAQQMMLPEKKMKKGDVVKTGVSREVVTVFDLISGQFA